MFFCFYCFFFFIDGRICFCFVFFFQAEDGIRVVAVTGVQTCALPICLPWLPVKGPGAIFPAIPRGRSRDAPGTRSKRRGFRQSPQAAGAAVETRACRAIRGVSRSANDRARDETRFERARHGNGCDHADDRTCDRRAARLPGLRLRRQPCCARRREPRDRRAGRTRRGAPRTRASCQPGPLAAPAHPRPCDLVGPEPAPAFVIVREPRTRVLPIHLTRRRDSRNGSLEESY